MPQHKAAAFFFIQRMENRPPPYKTALHQAELASALSPTSFS